MGNTTEVQELHEVPLERLEARICSGAANLTAAETSWLLDVAEFDRREGWAPWGSLSCAAWLSWQVGLDMRAAREKVRVAHALVAFPVIATAMASGQLSYSKARAITRIANVHNVDELVELALAATSNQVERTVAGYRRCEKDDEDELRRAFAMRGVESSTRRGLTHVHLRLPAEAAAAFLTAMDAFLEADPEATVVQRRADAAVAMAEHALATRDADVGPKGPRYVAVLHLGPNDLDGDDGDDGDDVDDVDDGSAEPEVEPEVPSQPASARRPASRAPGCGCTVAPASEHGHRTDPVAVPRSSARRMLCDAALDVLTVDEDGNPLRLGRASRGVNRKLRRALHDRDGGCRFPGCTHRGWLDCHHIIHWLDDGLTDIDNLLLLCRRHHRLVHEEGWMIFGNPGGEVSFVRPDGALLPHAPVPPTGDPSCVDAYGLTERDGRSRWEGDHLDVSLTVGILLHNEQVRRRRHDASQGA